MAVQTRTSLRDQGGALVRRVAALGEASEARNGEVPGEGEAPADMAVGGITQQGGNLAERLHLLMCTAGIIASLMLYSVLQVAPYPTSNAKSHLGVKLHSFALHALYP